MSEERKRMREGPPPEHGAHGEKRRGGAQMAAGYANHGASKTKSAMLGWMLSGGSPEDDSDLNGATSGKGQETSTWAEALPERASARRRQRLSERG